MRSNERASRKRHARSVGEAAIATAARREIRPLGGRPPRLPLKRDCCELNAICRFVPGRGAIRDRSALALYRERRSRELDRRAAQLSNTLALRRETPDRARARGGINETVGSPYMQRLTGALVSMASAAISISTGRCREGSSREVGSGACAVAEIRCSLAWALAALAGHALRQPGCGGRGRGSVARAL